MNNKWYVALTALESHWAESHNTLFLGEWCKLDKRRQVWAKYNPEVLSRVFETRNELERGVKLSLMLGERAYKQIASLLSKQYELVMPDRFFRQMLFCWTSLFSGVCYARYLSLKQACSLIDSPYFITCPTDPGMPPFYDPNQWRMAYGYSDAYHLYLTSQIISELGLNCEQRNMDFPKPNLSAQPNQRFSLKKRLTFFLCYRLNQLLGRDFYNVSYLYAGSIAAKLCKASKGQIIADECLDWPKVEVDLNFKLRNQAIDLGDDEFSTILGKIILKHIPWGIFEGMPAHLQIASRQPAYKAKAFITSTGFLGVLPYMYTAASSGSPIGVIAHGGYSSVHATNCNLYNEIEKIQLDRLYDSGSGSYPLPNLALYKVATSKLSSSQPSESVLYVSVVNIRYTKLGGMSAGKRKIYFDRQQKFFKKISPEIPVLYRKFFKHVEADDYDAICHAHSNLVLQSPEDCPFSQAVQQNKLVIIDACWYSLAALEMMLARKPAIYIYYDDMLPASLRMHTVMDKMAKAGFLFYDAESAAEQLNSVYDNVEEWWSRKEVQEALDLFANNFAKPIDNWPMEYFKALKQLQRDFPNSKL